MALLFLLACQSETPPADQPAAQALPPLFEALPASQTGITCVNTLPEGRYQNIIVYQYYYNGGGVGIGDLNDDGRPDVVITQNMEPNKLYLNQGAMRFQDATEAAGFTLDAPVSWTTGVALIDINQDGRLDIYLSRSGMLKPENRRNLLYLNEGTDANGVPQLREAAAEWGLDDAGYTVQTVFLDYDRDGDLDAFIMNHATGFFNSPAGLNLTAKDPDRGDKLMENRGDRFVEVTTQAGIQSNAMGYGLGVAVEDLNRDGWPDLYVSNDFYEHDYLYLNNQNGTFREVSHKALRHMSNYSMGNDAADINNDGWPDVMVLDMVAEDNRRLKANMSGMNPEDFYALVDNGFHHQYMFNSLHLNRGNETFSEMGQLAGVSNTDWSWAPLLADFDNDGWKDLYVTNGLRKDARNTDFRNSFAALLDKAGADPNRTDLTTEEWQQALASMPSERIPNYAYRNLGGSGLRFEKVSAAWGLAQPSFSNGAAYGDLDGDG
ncbi:MAG: VCBS repeat-containing protein, partial [Bacteroidetes bacterium]